MFDSIRYASACWHTQHESVILTPVAMLGASHGAMMLDLGSPPDLGSRAIRTCRWCDGVSACGAGGSGALARQRSDAIRSDGSALPLSAFEHHAGYHPSARASALERASMAGAAQAILLFMLLLCIQLLAGSGSALPLGVLAVAWGMLAPAGGL